jgi:hypothetical protein
MLAIAWTDTPDGRRWAAVRSTLLLVAGVIVYAVSRSAAMPAMRWLGGGLALLGAAGVGWAYLHADRGLLDGGLTRSADQPAPEGTLTVGETVKRGAHESAAPLAQQCLLCDSPARIEVGPSEARIDCGTCGRYRTSLDAARALGGLVTYRAPALIQIRTMMAAHRQRQPHGVPRIDVRYVISDRIPTFSLSD